MSKPILEIDEAGTKYWKLNGLFHNEDGPAIEYASGSKEWYLNGKRHRDDGPAYIGPDGYTGWWLNGKFYQPSNLEIFIRTGVSN